MDSIKKQDNNEIINNIFLFYLGGIFKATDNKPPIHVDAKAKWMWMRFTNAC